MKAPSTHLPKIKARFFLRRWVDRVAIECVAVFRSKPRSKKIHLCAFILMAIAYWVGPAVLALSLLVGLFFPSEWTAGGLVAGSLLWTLRWAIGPWFNEPDEETVRTLLPAQYQLIQDFCPTDQLDAVVSWALKDPHFDTRHLLACIEPHDGGDSFNAAAFKGTNALDLFDGLVGRRVEAIKQGKQLESETWRVDVSAANARRL